MKELRKISEGMSGFQAAEVIYSNDRELGKAIDACRKELDANKAFVAMIEGETPISLDVAQSTGSGVTSVMSQAAVTTELDSINATLNNVTKIAPITGTPEVIGELRVMTEASTAAKAMTDGNGNSIAGQFNEINAQLNGTSGLTATLNAVKETIESLEARIHELEEEKKKDWQSFLS